MNKLKLISVFGAALFLAASARGQEALNKKSIILNVGIGASRPDFRYNSPFTDPYGHVKTYRYDADMELYFTAVKPIRLVGNLDLTAGLGYAFLQKKPRLYVENGYFDVLNAILLTAKVYQIHQVQVPIGLQFSAVRKENFVVGVYANVLANFARVKHIEPDFQNRLTTFEFTPFSVESFAGLFMRTRRLSYSLDTRIFHGQFRDDALENNGKRFDPYNLFKIRFMVGYQL